MPADGPPAQTTDAACPGDEKRFARAARTHRRAEHAHRPLDDALDVEEVDGAALRRTSGPASRRRSRQRRRRGASPSAAEPRADLEQPDVVPAVPAVVRDRVDQARARSDGRSVSNFADSGLAMRDRGGAPRAANARAAWPR